MDTPYQRDARNVFWPDETCRLKSAVILLIPTRAVREKRQSIGQHMECTDGAMVPMTEAMLVFRLKDR